MARLEHQVLKGTLKNPICVAVFNNDGICGDITRQKADKLREDLNRAGINFAAVDHEPGIKISIDKEDTEKLKDSGIKLPSVFDYR